ncbi:MAG: hypothetical protein R6W76_09830 [Caldilinea sp.]
MTAHISPDELYALVFDNVEIHAAVGHLNACAACRRQVEELRQLATDLTVVHLSEPSPAALDRYQAMFAHVEVQPSPLQRAVQQIRAVLTWDSRLQPALQGMRGGANAYRQLYSAGDAEVELMIERLGRLRRVEGDLITGEDASNYAPALIELFDQKGDAVRIVETGTDGLFRLENVAVGLYRAVITRPYAATIEVEVLEIA